MQLAELQPKPQTLNFNGHEFTMILINGELYFNANEVANTLEFGNPHQAIATHVDKDDIQKMEVIDSLGRKQLANFLNESGLYALTFGSKKETAKKFKKWVTSEVLPSIRKTGGYSLQPQIALPNFTDPAAAAEAWAKEYREKQALAIENQTLKPKADAYEILSGAKGSVSIRVASGELKVPEKKFIQWLLDNDWAYREGNRTDGKLLPHAHRKEQGYLELVSVVTYNTGEAVARSQTKVTQKGLARLAQIFSKNRALLTHKISSNEVTA